MAHRGGGAPWLVVARGNSCASGRHLTLRRVAHPVIAPLVQVGFRQADKSEAAIEKVGLGVVEDGGGNQAAQRLDGYHQLHLLALAQHAHVDRVARELEVDDVLEGEALLRADGEAAVVCNLLGIEAQYDVATLEHRGSCGERRQPAHQHARAGAVDAIVLPQLLVLERLPEDAERAEARAPGVVGGRGVVRQEVLDGRHGNHVADVLGLLLVLEGDTDDAARLVDGRPAAVARVDGRVDLDGEQVGARVRVALNLNPRNHAHCHRHAFAALRISDH